MKLFKDAMPVSFRSELFTSYIFTIFKQRNLLPYIWKTAKYIFVENVCDANLALFIYVLTHCVETVKWLDYNRNSQLTRWLQWLRIRFWCENSRVQFPAMVFIFDFLFCYCWVFLLFCPKTEYLSKHFAISFAMLLYLVY